MKLQRRLDSLMWTDQYLSAVRDIAVAAGAEILSVYNENRQPEVSLKDDNSPITDADYRAHNLIVRRLSELTPTIPILSEESEPTQAHERLGWQRLWLVDPLDGTKEFINRNGEFTVNIALIENGEPITGVVHVPVSGVTYLGEQGAGAWRQDADGELTPIRCAPVSGQNLRVVASRSHRDDRIDGLLAAAAGLFESVEVVNMGSSLKICLLAAGEADLYPRLAPTCEWDTAAAHAVLAGAGGEILDLDLQPLRYNQKADLLNPYFLCLGDSGYPWSELLTAIQD